MVPYVRKSFYKHWIDGCFYIENIDKQSFAVKAFKPENCSIYDISYKEHIGAYRYAMEQTEKEIHQAVEGLYHNLNTLQSRSGNQLKWVAG